MKNVLIYIELHGYTFQGEAALCLLQGFYTLKLWHFFSFRSDDAKILNASQVGWKSMSRSCSTGIKDFVVILIYRFVNVSPEKTVASRVANLVKTKGMLIGFFVKNEMRQIKPAGGDSHRRTNLKWIQPYYVCKECKISKFYKN